MARERPSRIPRHVQADPRTAPATSSVSRHAARRVLENITNASTNDADASSHDTRVKSDASDERALEDSSETGKNHPLIPAASVSVVSSNEDTGISGPVKTASSPHFANTCDRLPEDVVYRVAEHLSPATRIKATQICRDWRAFLRNQSALWADFEISGPIKGSQLAHRRLLLGDVGALRELYWRNCAFATETERLHSHLLIACFRSTLTVLVLTGTNAPELASVWSPHLGHILPVLRLFHIRVPAEYRSPYVRRAPQVEGHCTPQDFSLARLLGSAPASLRELHVSSKALSAEYWNRGERGSASSVGGLTTLMLPNYMCGENEALRDLLRQMSLETMTLSEPELALCTILIVMVAPPSCALAASLRVLEVNSMYECQDRILREGPLVSLPCLQTLNWSNGGGLSIQTLCRFDCPNLTKLLLFRLRNTAIALGAALDPGGFASRSPSLQQLILIEVDMADDWLRPALSRWTRLETLELRETGDAKLCGYLAGLSMPLVTLSLNSDNQKRWTLRAVEKLVESRKQSLLRLMVDDWLVKGPSDHKRLEGLVPGYEIYI